MSSISVIVPVYNVELWLPRCIDSILNQTFTDFELILVDDGSTDNCPAICDAYAVRDTRVKVIHTQNGGVSAARNAGLNMAQGKYITFVDSDDYVASERLEILYQNMVQYSADVVVAGYVAVDEGNRIIRHQVHKEPGQRAFASQDDVTRYIYHNIFEYVHGWEVWSRLFRRDIIAENNILFPTTCGNYAEDLGFTLAYTFFSKRIIGLEDTSYFYMHRTGSMMRQSKNAVKLDQLNELSKWLYPYYCSFYGSGQHYAVMHLLIMHTEYSKILQSTEAYARLGNYLDTIEDQAWYRLQTRNIRKCSNELDIYFGKRARQRARLFSHYCQHRNWKRFTYESAIAYRFIIAKE